LGKRLLILGGIFSFAVALLHVGIAIYGGSAYITFGAGEEFTRLDASGSPVPMLVTLGLALIFAICGLYALSGASVLRRLPLLLLALIGIGAVYTLRGLLLLPELYSTLAGTTPASHGLIFSAVSLLIGLCYLIGTILSWKQLSHKPA
jgi:hypothetical protein